jgi:hypothetical protein
MANFVLTDASVVINAVDLSDQVRQVTVSVEADVQENTAMGDTYRSRLGGLKDWSIEVEFNQDFAASEVDATLWSCLGTPVTVTAKGTSSAVGTANPSFSGSAILSAYAPLDGSVGDVATTSVTFQGAGTLTRATS